jgi:hypothetical protein
MHHTPDHGLIIGLQQSGPSPDFAVGGMRTLVGESLIGRRPRVELTGGRALLRVKPADVKKLEAKERAAKPKRKAKQLAR